MRGVIGVWAAILLLVSFATGQSGIALIKGKLDLDVQVLNTAHLYRLTIDGLSGNDATFERTAGLVGLTGTISPVVSVRAYFDVGGYLGGPALDMYANFAWPSGFGLRVGQFLPPLGFDYMTDFVRQPLVNSSLIQAYDKPNGGRDIGTMGMWQNQRFSVAAALVNGAGANTADNNNKKDLCARLTVRPFKSVDATLAVRGYYGWPDPTDTAWWTAAAEARLQSGSLELQAEFQNHSGSDLRNSAAYLQAAWKSGWLRPATRLDLILPRGELSEWMMTGGVELKPASDHVSVMLDGSYRRNYQGNWSVLGFLFRVQAWL